MKFGPQNIIWGLKNGGWGARPPGPPPGSTIIQSAKLIENDIYKFPNDVSKFWDRILHEDILLPFCEIYGHNVGISDSSFHHAVL